jgi:hypothetical protein
MRKVLFPVAFLLVVSLLHPNSFTFRKTRWGMTSREVGRVETARFVKRIGYGKELQLLYRTAIGGMKGRVVYDFSANRLVKTRYIFVLYNVEQGIGDYRIFRQVLVKKYGQPRLSWRVEAVQHLDGIRSLPYLILPFGPPMRAGLKKGGILLKTTWNNPEAVIELTLENKLDPELYILTVRYENPQWAATQRTLEAQNDKSLEDALFDAL